MAETMSFARLLLGKVKGQTNFNVRVMTFMEVALKVVAFVGVSF